MLTAHNLHKHYRMGDQKLPVLRGTNLSASRGQWIAIVGASGSGKSTLLQLLGGLDRPDEGKVEFEGRDIFDRPGRALDRYRNTKVGFVFQFYHLLPELTALENVLIGAMIGTGAFAWPAVRRRMRREAESLLDRLGLLPRQGHRPSRLSGGERQRVAIARALINHPPLLLADEPTGNLDTESGTQLLQVFRHFHESGQTIIMVTHDQQVAAAAQCQLKLESGRLSGPQQAGS